MQSWRLGQSSTIGGIVSISFPSLCLLQAYDDDSANPNKKAADLISFDAFAHEEPMSGDGSLSLPSDSAQSSSAQATPGAEMSSAGLPLDLFSAPSPTPSPGFGLPAGTSHSHSAGKQKQDPMAFFNTPVSAQPSPSHGSQFGMGGMGMRMGMGQHQQQQQQHQQRVPSNGMDNGLGGTFGGMGQTQQPTTPMGYSLSPSQPTNIGAGSGTSTPQPSQQSGQQQLGHKKPDAFADLVDLMG